jgi:hypothetical protein
VWIEDGVLSATESYKKELCKEGVTMRSEDKTHQDAPETLCNSLSYSSVSVSDFETKETETVGRYGRGGGLRVSEVWFRVRKATSVPAVRFTALSIDVVEPRKRVLSSCSPETCFEVRRAEARDGFVHESDPCPDARLITESKRLGASSVDGSTCRLGYFGTLMCVGPAESTNSDYRACGTWERTSLA